MTAHDEYRVRRVEVKKTKAQLEFKLVQNLRVNVKGLYKHISSKQKTKEKWAKYSVGHK